MRKKVLRASGWPQNPRSEGGDTSVFSPLRAVGFPATHDLQVLKDTDDTRGEDGRLAPTRQEAAVEAGYAFGSQQRAHHRTEGRTSRGSGELHPGLEHVKGLRPPGHTLSEEL